MQLRIPCAIETNETAHSSRLAPTTICQTQLRERVRLVIHRAYFSFICHIVIMPSRQQRAEPISIIIHSWVFMCQLRLSSDMFICSVQSFISGTPDRSSHDHHHHHRITSGDAHKQLLKFLLGVILRRKLCFCYSRRNGIVVRHGMCARLSDFLSTCKCDSP